jgi:hypothetical protein
LEILYQKSLQLQAISVFNQRFFFCDTASAKARAAASTNLHVHYAELFPAPFRTDYLHNSPMGLHSGPLRK